MKVRGKRKDNGKWIYGEVYTLNKQKFILPPGCTDGVEVYPDTVTMCSGLNDKNGTPIYEGDIYTSGESGVKYFVYFISGAFCGGRSKEFTEPLGWTCDEHDKGFTGELTECEFYSTIEVVGNRFEVDQAFNLNMN